MSTAIVTNDSLLVSLGILPKPRSEDSGAGRLKFQRGHFFAVDYDSDKRENVDTDLGTTMRAVVLPMVAYEAGNDGRARPRLAHEFYQGFRSDQKRVCRSYTQIVRVEDISTESSRRVGYAGHDREFENDCEACHLGAIDIDGKWKRIKEQSRLPEGENPCKWRGEMLVIPDGMDGARKLGLSYTSLQQVRGSFKDHREGTDPKIPTLAALLESKPEWAQAFVEGRLICEFGSFLAKSDNKQIGTYEVMSVKPVGETEESMLPTVTAVEMEDADEAAPWESD